MNIQNFNYLNLNNISYKGNKFDNDIGTVKKEAVGLDNPVKVHGYTKFLKNHRMYGHELCEIMKNSPETPRYIGSPPKGWLNKNFSYDEKKEQVQKIFNSFSDFSLNVSALDEGSLALNEAVDDFNAQISNILNKDVKVSYLNQGSLGKAFLIELDGKKFVLKNFKKSRGTGNGHGRSEEQQQAIYVQNNEQKGRYCEFYFGKLASCDNHDGFYVTEYCEDLNKKPVNKKLSYEERKRQGFDVPFITSDDYSSDNTKGGKIIDFGGLNCEFPQLEDGKTRKYVRVVCNFMKNGHEDKAVEYINRHSDDKKMLQALKIIEYATCSKTDFFCDSFIEKHGIEFK